MYATLKAFSFRYHMIQLLHSSSWCWGQALKQPCFTDIICLACVHICGSKIIWIQYLFFRSCNVLNSISWFSSRQAGDIAMLQARVDDLVRGASVGLENWSSWCHLWASCDCSWQNARKWSMASQPSDQSLKTSFPRRKRPVATTRCSKLTIFVFGWKTKWLHFSLKTKRYLKDSLAFQPSMCLQCCGNTSRPRIITARSCGPEFRTTHPRAAGAIIFWHWPCNDDCLQTYI